MHINTTLPFNVRGKSPATHHKVRLKTAAYPKVNSLLNNVGGLKAQNHSSRHFRCKEYVVFVLLLTQAPL